jgi:hypothetical protein
MYNASPSGRGVLNRLAVQEFVAQVDAENELRRRLDEARTSANTALARDIEAELREWEPKRRKVLGQFVNQMGAVYDPRLKLVDGKSVDIANLGYDDLPPDPKDPTSFNPRKENRETARVIVEQIQEQVARGGKLDEAFAESASKKVHDEWMERNKSWAPKHQMLPFGELSKEEADKDRVLVQKGIRRLERFSVNYGGKAFGAAVTVARRSAPKSVLLAGGLLGAAMYVGLEAFDATGTSCTEYQDAYVNSQMKSLGNDCYRELAPDERVMNFFNLPEEKQRALLKNENICGFYRELHAKFFAQPRFKSLDCRKDRFVLETENADGSADVHEARYWINTKNLRVVSTKRVGHGATGQLYLKKDGDTVENANTPFVAKQLAKLKLFLPDAAACCAGVGADRNQCLAAYNERVKSAGKAKVGAGAGRDGPGGEKPSVDAL